MAEHRVAVVDDEQMVRGYLTRVFENEGFSTVTADSPTSCRDLFTDGHEIDVLVLDRHLAGRDCIDLVHEILACPTPPKVLVISGLDVDPATRDVLASRGVAFLPKPFYPDALLAEIDGLLGGA